MRNPRSRPGASGNGFGASLAGDGLNHNPDAPVFQDPPYLARREPCRKCGGDILAIYFLDRDLEPLGWGGLPLGPCGRPDRCAEKVIGLAPGDLAIAYRTAGSA